jgi:hypothetical protein
MPHHHAQLHVISMSSLVIMEDVHLKRMSVTRLMTVEITVMKMDVVCDKGMLDYMIICISGF